MAKIISYKFQIEQAVLNKNIMCSNKDVYEANYPIVEKEAIPGTIRVSGEFDSELEVSPTADDILNTLLGVTE